MNCHFFAIFTALFLTASVGLAKMESRPQSMGGDFLVEFNTGYVFEGSEGVFELGFDFERFISGTHHHFSIGLATELVSTDSANEYYLGPMLSAYYFHFKAFLTSGVLTDLNGHDEWKSRFGLGYEVIWTTHWIFVPTVAVDFHRSEFFPGVVLGLACEF